MKPLYKHDCKKCILLGQAKGCDIYLCTTLGGDQDQLIIRTGSEGPDYECCRVQQLRYRGVYHDGTLNILWVYALGLYDGWRQHAADELAKKGIEVVEELRRET